MPLIPHVTDTSPVVDSAGCVSQAQIDLRVDTWTVGPDSLPEEMASSFRQGIGATQLHGNPSWVNRTAGWPVEECASQTCSVELIEGNNEIVLEARDQLRKVGRSRVTVCYPGDGKTCADSCG